MSFKSSTNESNIIVVRTFETVNALYSAKLTVFDGAEISKTIPLDLLKKNGDENALKIVSTLNEIKSKGYMLVSSNSGGADGNIITNYIFEKR